MVDIARQTVEFLYEENGGIPRDLYLPTIEDIKDEANKFTIDKVRKGTLYTHFGRFGSGRSLASAVLTLAPGPSCFPPEVVAFNTPPSSPQVSPSSPAARTVTM